MKAAAVNVERSREMLRDSCLPSWMLRVYYSHCSDRSRRRLRKKWYSLGPGRDASFVVFHEQTEFFITASEGFQAQFLSDIPDNTNETLYRAVASRRPVPRASLGSD